MDNSTNLGRRNLNFLSDEQKTEKKTTSIHDANHDISLQNINQRYQENLLKLEYYKEQAISLNENLNSEIENSKITKLNLQQIKLQLDIAQKELVEAKSDLKANLQQSAEIDILKKDIESKQNEVLRLNQSLNADKEATETKFKLLNQSKETIQTQLTSRSTELSELKARLSIYRAEQEIFKTAATELKIENQKINQNIAHIESIASANSQLLQTSIDSLQVELKSKNAIIKDKEQLLQSIQSDVLNMKNQFHLSELEIQKMTQNNIHLADSLSTNTKVFQASIDSLQAELILKNTLLKEKEQNLSTAQSEMLNMTGQFHVAQLENQKLAQQIQILDADLQAQTNKFIDSEKLSVSATASSNEKIKSLHVELEGCKSLVQTLQKEFQQKTKISQEYLGFLSTEKNRLDTALDQLAKEIHSAISLHPLKDVLQMTENELSNYELQLKKMPLATPNRKLTEHKFDKLFQQRNQLRELIETSNRSLLNYSKKTVQFKKNLDVFEMPML